MFEQFRKTIIFEYELDPAHYLTLPGLGWSAMLKTAGVELGCFKITTCICL